METAIIGICCFVGGIMVTLCAAALAAGSLDDPDDDAEVNGPEFL